MKKFGLRQKLTPFFRLFRPGVNMPIYLLMFVTSRCDAKCKHCFFMSELNKTKRELTLDEFETLSKSFGPMFQVTLTGGSPELRKDLPEIAEIFFRNCRPSNITVCCNGNHPKRIISHIEKILELCPGQKLTVALSVDGLKEEHDALRGVKGLFDRVTDTFDGLSDLREKYPNLSIGGAICVSDNNHENAVDTAKWARENLPLDLFKPILVRDDKPGPVNDCDHLVNAYLQIVENDRQFLGSKKLRRKTPFDFMVRVKEIVQRRLISEISQTGKYPAACGAAREVAVIYPDGSVPGCEMKDEMIGNVHQAKMDFKSIWYSQAADKFRAQTTAGKCGCYHHCFLSPPIFRSPKLWPKLFGALVKVLRNAD